MTKREGIRAKARAIAAKLRPILPDLRDLHVYGGVALIAVGVAHAWRPLGYIAAGALLLYIGLPEKRPRRGRPE